MRWLLIALLVVLQLQAPAVASAMDAAGGHGAPQVASCHEAPAAPEHGSDHAPATPAKGKAVAHLCPGCSIPGIAPDVAPAAALRPVPPVAPALAALASLEARPSVPPPRAA